MPKISIIFVTNRSGWYDILKENLGRQTFNDFEVIVANDSDDWGAMPNWFVFKPRQKKQGEAWNLNKAYNDCIDRANGELLVFLQDFIWIPDYGLEKFWKVYLENPNSFVTGVGNKAKDGLEGISEYDLRMNGPDGVHMIDPMIIPWEMNWASAPRVIMPRFEEKMDSYYGGENIYISRKAYLFGAMFMIDRSNQCIGYSQEYCGGRPHDWEELHANKEGRLAAFLEYLNRITVTS